MNLHELLQELARAGIQLRAAGEQLEILAPKGAVTTALRDALTRQKPALLSWLREQAMSASGPLPVAIEPDQARRYDPFPLTDIQQAYWVGRSGMLDQGEVATHFYVEIEVQDLDVERLSAAWQKVVRRHDMLRAIVLPHGEQRILPDVPLYHIPLTDLCGKGDSELEAIRARLSHQVLKTDRWPLFEIQATRLNEHAFRVHVSLDLLICDLESMLRLFQEWAQYYRDPARLVPPPQLSFRDYVIAEKTLRDGPEYRRARDYWLGRLDTLPAAPQLPLAKDPASIGRHRFARRQALLPAGEWQRLKQRASRAGLTPSGVLLAAFAEILGTWSKSLRFTLNLTVFNRMPLHPQVQEIVGDFTCVSLLEVDLTPRESFESLAARVRKQLWADLEHRLFSGVNVLRELARRQGGYRGVAIPVVFTSALGSSPSNQDASVFSQLGETAYSISQTPQVWLDHQVLERGGDLIFNWDAVEAIFPPRLLDDMFAAYCEFLHRLAGTEEAWTPETRQHLPMAQAEERAAANATGAVVSEGLLHAGFLKQAALRPDAPAVIASSRTLTYSQLARQAAGIGHRLREAGASPNTLVAVVMEKGWEQIAAVLGILMAGAGYVPIDPDLPTERRWHLLESAQARVALTQPSLDALLDWPSNIVRIPIDDGMEAISGPAGGAQSPQDLAYVIHTSGSSGTPKGVMIAHRSAVNTIDDINRRFHVGPGDRVLSLSALSFDLSVYDIFGLLAAGGAVVLPDQAAAKDPAHWAEMIQRHGVTIWNSVPALMQLLVDDAAVRGRRLPESLRLAMLSGDWISLPLPSRIRALSDRVEIVSLGGATEASIWSIFYRIGEIGQDWKSIPYGQPLANQRFHILNARLEPSPCWVPGDLYIAGAGLAEGYWRDEMRTQASFVVHPENGERLYKTGDLGRYLPGGIIEFLGREDYQVKVNGYRIELGEIESALRQHPEVREAVAAAVGPVRGQRQLVGYVVCNNGIQDGALREFLRGKLPQYMIPSFYMKLDSLPLSSNGKVDRKRLPSPVETQTARARERVAPNGPTEELIVTLWKEVLRVQEVGVHDSFFDLGGDSVAAIQLMSRIRQALSVELPLRRLFDSPTPAGLADAVTAMQMEESGPEEIARLLATVEGLSEQEAERML